MIEKVIDDEVAHGDDERISVDEILLALMDAVALAFPAVLHWMRVDWVPAEDSQRPALYNLNASGPTDAPRRPNLGFKDDAVLDSIQGLIENLVDGVFGDSGLRIVRGHVDIKDGADGARDVQLWDDASKPAELIMTRRFDASELRSLVWTAPLFQALAETEAAEAQQSKETAAALAGSKRFAIDMRLGQISFDDGKGPRWQFQLLGSYLHDTTTFLWGWANDQVAPPLMEKMDALRASSTAPGLRALWEPSLVCPALCAERLARHAAVRVGAAGVYCAPFASTKGKGFMMLALFPDALP